MLALSSNEFHFWSAWYCQLGITWLCIDSMSGDIHRSSNSVDFVLQLLKTVQRYLYETVDFHDL
jgi:hypothetical protein